MNKVEDLKTDTPEIHKDRQHSFNIGYPWPDMYIERMENIGLTRDDIANILSKPTLKQENMNNDSLLIDIPAIIHGRNETIKFKKDIDSCIEFPLRESIHVLYDKNIETIGSSANFKNIGANAYIMIDKDSISEENINIIKDISDINITEQCIEIPFKCGITTKVKDIKDYFETVCKRLKIQPLLWGNTEISVSDLRRGEKNYDRTSDKLFFSEELKEKYLDGINKNEHKRLKEYFNKYQEYKRKDYIWKAVKMGVFYEQEFIDWIKYIEFGNEYQEIKENIENRE